MTTNRQVIKTVPHTAAEHLKTPSKHVLYCCETAGNDNYSQYHLNSTFINDSKSNTDNDDKKMK